MSEPHDQDGARPDRRTFLTLAGAATLAAAGRPSVGHADDQLDALMGDAQRGDFGQGFDDASRTIQMPKASLPTLSPATVQHTEQAIEQFEAIVAHGGWPEVPPSTQLRLGGRHPSVDGAAPAADRVGRSRRQRRRVRHLQFLRRGGGAPLPGPPRPHVDGIVREADAEGAQRAGRGAARAAPDQSGAAAHA